MGINLRKEAQKIDLKQFNSSDIEHVEPIISVMRPPTAYNEDEPEKIANRKRTLKDEREKEALKMQQRRDRAWRRLRPEMHTSQQEMELNSNKDKDDGDNDYKDTSSVLPAVNTRRPVTQGSHTRNLSL